MTVHSIFRLAKALGVSAIYLIDGADSVDYDPMREADTKEIIRLKEENRKLHMWADHIRKSVEYQP
jgi:hypothetical protein